MPDVLEQLCDLHNLLVSRQPAPQAMPSLPPSLLRRKECEAVRPLFGGSHVQDEKAAGLLRQLTGLRNSVQRLFRGGVSLPLEMPGRQNLAAA